MYERDYFVPGSAGLRAFIPEHLVDSERFESVVTKNRAYYASTRAEMAKIPSVLPRVREGLVRFKSFYPDAVFPEVYFVVGALNSAGTRVRGTGLVIGAEVLSRPATLPASVPLEVAKTLRPIDAVPGVVLHELAHYNQDDERPYALLDSTLVEGSADFLGELAGAREGSDRTWTFACAHEDALWRAFEPLASRNDRGVLSFWLYSHATGPLGGPPSIGYWIGYRIAQTYYDKVADKRAAVHDMLNIKDFRAFLAASGYSSRRPACRRETPWMAQAR